MDLLQSELNNVSNMWNTHLIRSSGAETVSGIPDELYFLPGLGGEISFVVYYIVLVSVLYRRSGLEMLL